MADDDAVARPLIRPALTLASIVVLGIGAVSVSAAPRVTAPPTTFVVTGGGWGHGVGMSQWGAYGQAVKGRSHAEILATYYPGTTPGTTTTKKVRVLVVPRAKKLRVSSSVPFRLRDAAAEVVEVPAGGIVLGPKLRVVIEGERRSVAGPLTVKPGPGAPLTVAGKGYRGELRVVSDGKRLQVVNVVGLETYLLGVVPGEVPKDWPLEALKAQAVAARTYAVTSLVKDKEFDLFSDWRSQLYYGAESEAPATTQAVQETRGRILTFEGKPALTLYFSSSGGRTRSALDTFGLDLPYLRPVDDPWDAVETNPNHLWEASALTGKQLTASLKLRSRVTDAVTELGGDGRPTLVRFTTAAGATSELTARDVRTSLGLRSTSFRIGVMRLVPPETPVSAGSAVVLSGIARDVEEPALERREAEGTWVRDRRIVAKPDGSFSVTVRLTGTVTYRLTGAGLPGPAVTLAVAGTP